MVGEENKGYMKKRKESLKGGRNGFRRILGRWDTRNVKGKVSS